MAQASLKLKIHLSFLSARITITHHRTWLHTLNICF